MSICSDALVDVRPGVHRLAERIQVHHDEVEGLDLELLQRGDVLGAGCRRAVRRGHVGAVVFHPAVEDLRESGDEFDRVTGMPLPAMVFAVDPVETMVTPASWSPCASGMRPLLSYHADQCTPDRLLTDQGLRRHLEDRLSAVPVHARVASAASTSTRSRRSTVFDALVQVSSSSPSRTTTASLGQDRPGVHPGVHHVHRAAGDLHRAGQCVGNGMGTGNDGSNAGWVFTTRPGKRERTRRQGFS